MSTFLLKTYYERTLALDGEDGVTAQVPLRIRRFTLDEGLAHGAAWQRLIESPAYLRHFYRRPDAADEQARHAVTLPGGLEIQVHDLPDEEIQRRRVAEMDAPTLAAFEAERAAIDAEGHAFLVALVQECVSVDPRYTLQVEDETGTVRRVQTGADLVAVFGGQLTVLAQIGRLVHEENTVAPEKKRRLRSRLPFSTGFPTPEAPGPTPAGTAAAAAPPVSARRAPAPGRRRRRRSG